jgi:flavorubredoxin
VCSTLSTRQYDEKRQREGVGTMTTTHTLGAVTTDISTAPPLIRTTAPYRIAEETYLIPNVVPGAPGAFIGMNSLLIRGAEPVIVDTGTPLHSDHWLDMVLSLIDPEDIRWVFLSHDDGDHVGSLAKLMAMAPNATVVANFFMTERLSVEHYALPLNRLRWIGPGESFDAGDRTLHLVRPPIFDGPTTRGLYDAKTATLWAVDSFAAMTPQGVYEAGDVPRELYDETFPMFNSLVSPWHEWLDPVKYSAHTDELESLGLLTVASAHGPVLRGQAIHDAFDRVRALAGKPNVPSPGQSLLDELIASTTVPAQSAGV